jgi:hypothetical protein
MLTIVNPFYYNGKKTIVTPNTLETMIEYTLILNILYKIREMTKKPLEYPRDDTKLDPL